MTHFHEYETRMYFRYSRVRKKIYLTNYNSLVLNNYKNNDGNFGKNYWDFIEIRFLSFFFFFISNISSTKLRFIRRTFLLQFHFRRWVRQPETCHINENTHLHTIQNNFLYYDCFLPVKSKCCNNLSPRDIEEKIWRKKFEGIEEELKKDSEGKYNEYIFMLIYTWM